MSVMSVFSEGGGGPETLRLKAKNAAGIGIGPVSRGLDSVRLLKLLPFFKRYRAVTAARLGTIPATPRHAAFFGRGESPRK